MSKSNSKISSDKIVTNEWSKIDIEKTEVLKMKLDRQEYVKMIHDPEGYCTERASNLERYFQHD